MKKRSGFTLIEVVAAFLLLSFIVIMVTSTMTSAYAISAKLHELPNTYYSAQDSAEKEIDKVTVLVRDKYWIENEIRNTPTSELDPTLITRLDNIDDELENYDTRKVTLFNQEIEIYKIDTEYVADNGTKLTIQAGVINAQTLDRLVPIIDEVSIKSKETSNPDLYFSEDTEVNVSVKYNSKNQDYKYKDLYQWYIGTGDFHTVVYSDGKSHIEESRYDTLYTSYPNNFTLLPGETKSTIKLKENYYGQMLVCVVTPLSKNGAMGQSVVSNQLYISALPELDRGTYTTIIDVSSTPFDYTTNPTMQLNSISSRNLLSVTLTAVNKPTVSLQGEATATHEEDSLASRFISFINNTSMKTSLSITGSKVFIVAKNNTSSKPDFLTIGSTNVGFYNNKRITSDNTDSEWQVIEANISSGKITIGNYKVDVAEIIITSGTNNADNDLIWKYLLDKYHIVEGGK